MGYMTDTVWYNNNGNDIYRNKYLASASDSALMSRYRSYMKEERRRDDVMILLL